MARNAEIIFLAVLVFTGSAVTMSLGALMARGAIVGYPNWTSPAGGVFGYYAMAASIIVIGLGGWGIASGVGILNTRQWARISTLRFGTISLLIAIPGALEMFLDPRAGVSYLEGSYLGSIRPEMMALYGCLAAFGAFSLYFLNKRASSRNSWDSCLWRSDCGDLVDSPPATHPNHARLLKSKIYLRRVGQESAVGRKLES